MSEEEAKELLKYFTLEECKKRCEEDDTCNDCYIDIDQVKAIETVLNMLEEKDKEIEYYTTQRKYNENFKHELLEKIRCKSLEIDRLNEIIDLMAEQLAGLTIYESVDNMVILSDKKEEVIKYFERKVENE